MRHALQLLLLIVFVVPAVADEKAKPLTPEQAADQALAAFKAKDAPSLRALVEKDDPDPWLVADELRHRGEHDAAEAFARAAPRKTIGKLPAYVASRRGEEPDEKARNALTAMSEAMRRKEWQKAVDLADGVSLHLDSIVRVQVAYSRGLALGHVRRRRESARVLADVGEATARMGWLSRSLAAFHQGGLDAYDESDWAGAVAAWTSRLAVLREIDDTRATYQALYQMLNNRGLVQSDLGNYPEALRSHNESLAIRREIRDKRGIAETLHSVGLLQKALGNYAEALDANHEALAIRRQRGDKRGIAESLNNIGIVQGNLGNDSEALRFYDEALAIRREIGNDHGLVATFTNIGLVQQRLGNYTEALRSYDEALAIRRKSGDTHGIVATLNNIGLAQDSLGNYPEAREAYAQAQRLLDDSPDPATQASVWAGLAAHHLRQGQPAKAVGFARQGVQLVGGLAGGLAEGEGAGARDRFVPLFDVGTLAALRAEQVADLLWFLEQGRAASLREGLGSRAALEGAVLPEGLRAAVGLARNKERRALAAYRGAARGGKRKEIRNARRAWEESRAEVERVTARIQREAKAAASVTLDATDDLELIQSRLRSDEALLLFGLTREEALALVVRKDKARMVALPESKEIGSAVEALLGDEEQHVVPDMADALSTLLVEPLEIDKDVTRVLVSPVGRLGYVPFALLFPDHEVVYVPSGTTYGLLLEEQSKHGERILGLGDPDYQTAVDAIALRMRAGNVMKLPRLPATKMEVEAVADVRLLDKQATETALQDAIKKQERWRAVHFACHGLVDPERPMLSALALTSDEANDGFLTALEIFRMSIPTDLVVMSACETGKGKIYGTEGIVGLTRAFMFAGSARVICSLWNVDDEATQALMIKFYELWNPKDGTKALGAAAALEEAQAYIRSQEKWSHPYYWAAWVLWGLPN